MADMEALGNRIAALFNKYALTVVGGTGIDVALNQSGQVVVTNTAPGGTGSGSVALDTTTTLEDVM